MKNFNKYLSRERFFCLDQKDIPFNCIIIRNELTSTGAYRIFIAGDQKSSAVMASSHLISDDFGLQEELHPEQQPAPLLYSCNVFPGRFRRDITRLLLLCIFMTEIGAMRKLFRIMDRPYPVVALEDMGRAG
jgi:hypothetical protein